MDTFPFHTSSCVDDGSGELFIPYHFQDLFEPAYFAGAKLHSDSWGGGYTYDSFCLDVDSYTYTHQDFLAFFAAGNDGHLGAHTVLSPALAKNAVAVGGSISSSDSHKMKVQHHITPSLHSSHTWIIMYMYNNFIFSSVFAAIDISLFVCMCICVCVCRLWQLSAQRGLQPMEGSNPI